MADFDSKLPIRGLAADLTTEIANSSGTTINPVEEFAQGSTTSGQKGPLDQGAVTTTAPTYVTGTTQPLSLDTAGNLRVAGTDTITGNVTVIQPTGTNLHAVIDNFPADADALAQGSTTSGQLGSLTLAAVTTAAPSYTTAQTSPLSLTLAGALRVDGSAVTQPISAASLPLPAGAATEATLLAAKLDLDKFTFTATRLLVDGSGVTQPISGSVSVSNFPADADALAQASATSGQLGALVMGAVTTAAPTYTTGQTDPLSLTTGGALRVAVVSTVSGTSDLVTYDTHAALAANASSTQTYTPGTDVYLDGVDASASGQLKVEIQIAAATKCVMFTSKGNLQMMWRLNNPIFVASDTAITVIRTNMDNQAMDVYSNIQTHL